MVYSCSGWRKIISDWRLSASRGPPWKLSGSVQHYRIENLREALNWASILTGDAVSRTADVLLPVRNICLYVWNIVERALGYWNHLCIASVADHNLFIYANIYLSFLHCVYKPITIYLYHFWFTIYMQMVYVSQLLWEML